MDAADGSERMLEKAREKHIYKTLKKVWLGKDTFDARDSENNKHNI